MLARLGPHEAAVSCVYLRRLGGEVGGADVEVLTELVRLGHACSAVTGASGASAVSGSAGASGAE